MYSITLGVDIAKMKFDVALLIENRYKHKHFTNDIDGFGAFIAWLSTFDLSVQPLVCMEATGAYSLPLADFLVAQDYPVSVVNPAKIHAFANTLGAQEASLAGSRPTIPAGHEGRAKLISRYALSMQPALWTPPRPEMRRLQALTRRVGHLLEIEQMERNRLDTADESVKEPIYALRVSIS